MNHKIDKSNMYKLYDALENQKRKQWQNYWKIQKLFMKRNFLYKFYDFLQNFIQFFLGFLRLIHSKII